MALAYDGAIQRLIDAFGRSEEHTSEAAYTPTPNRAGSRSLF